MKLKRCVIVICDSLRNDMVGDGTPVLLELASRGVRFAEMRAVFPSTTRVSAASIATGCLPERHGLLGNTMILATDAGLEVKSVALPQFRDQLKAATGSHLKVPTLAQRLATRCQTAIYSNVSPGAAYFFDPDGAGYVFHRAGSYGPGRKPLSDDDGLHVQPGAEGDTQMTRRFCQHLMSDRSLGLAVLWLSEPDSSGHATPLGSAEHRAAIRSAERCVAQVNQAVSHLREQGDDILFMVGSDHGMETIVREVDIAACLVEAGLKESAHSRDIVVAPNGTAAVLGLAHDYREYSRLLRWLSKQEWVGAFVTGAELADWGMPDTSSCRVAISMAQSNTPNIYGVSGAACYAIDPTESKRYLGRGQHGGRNPNESSPFLIVEGGEFTGGSVVTSPASLIDYAPTVLRHLELDWNGMQGFPLQQRLSAFGRQVNTSEDRNESTSTC